jgi:hypothetical protein
MSSGPIKAGAEDYGTSVCVLSNRHLGILIFPLWGKWFYRNDSLPKRSSCVGSKLGNKGLPIGLNPIIDGVPPLRHIVVLFLYTIRV